MIFTLAVRSDPETARFNLTLEILLIDLYRRVGQCGFSVLRFNLTLEILLIDLERGQIGDILYQRGFNLTLEILLIDLRDEGWQPCAGNRFQSHS